MYPILVVLTAAIFACGYAAESQCPAPDEIEPCTCFKARVSQRVTALCQNFTEPSEVTDIFNKNPNWNLDDVNLDACTMPNVPASVLEKARFKSLNVSNTVLGTLFDVAPKKTPKLNLYLHNLVLMLGFKWHLFSNLSLIEFGAYDTQISSIGNDFRASVSPSVERIWFEKTSTRKITLRAFGNLKKLRVLAIRRAMLKSLSRNMFPKPWSSITILDFSFNKIMTLPENMFVDMPKMEIFLFERNLLTTMSEKTFFQKALYNLKDNPLNCDCNMKWITTTTKIDRSLVKGKCAEPSNLKGRDLEKLKSDDFSDCN